MVLSMEYAPAFKHGKMYLTENLICESTYTRFTAAYILRGFMFTAEFHKRRKTMNAVSFLLGMFTQKNFVGAVGTK